MAVENDSNQLNQLNQVESLIGPTSPPNYRYRQVSIDRQTDRQTGRQAGRQVGRQAGRHALGLVRKSVHGWRIIGNTAN